MFKGGILNAWGKKMAVALDSPFFDTLPELKEVEKDQADIAWLVYDLVNSENRSFELQKNKIVYTKFTEALKTFSQPKVGKIEKFLDLLQLKVDEKLENPPDNKTIDSPFGK